MRIASILIGGLLAMALAFTFAWLGGFDALQGWISAHAHRPIAGGAVLIGGITVCWAAGKIGSPIRDKDTFGQATTSYLCACLFMAGSFLVASGLLYGFVFTKHSP